MLLRLPDGTCDTETGVVRRGETTQTLTAKERELLAFLAGRPGEVVSTEELLREVWGYAPTAETRAVFHTCRRLRAKIEPNPSSPTVILAERSVGYRLVIDSGRRPEPRTEARAPQVRPPPAERNRFFGRAAELDELAERYTRGDRLVTVVGMGGIGKTRLATHFGRHRWSGPVAFCDVVAARSGVDVAVAVLTATGAAAGDEPPLVAAARRCASLGRCLLVVDNAETALAATREVVDTCLDAAPELRVLVTSRVPLGLAGESRLALFGLDRSAAIALVDARAEGGSVDPATLDAVATRLGGVPLAIELAAARTALVGPGALRSLLGEQGDGTAWVHELADTTAGERHAEMAAVLAGTCALLPAGALDALGRLSVFEGGFLLEAAEAVGAAPALAVLLRTALVQRVGDARFTMLPLVRAYAREQLGEDELTHARDRHASWVRDHLAGPGRSSAESADEQENLLAACAWALRGPRDDVGTLVELAWKVLPGTGALSRAAPIAAAALQVDGLRPEEAARAARGAMFVLRRVGELRAAIGAGERLEAAGRALGEADPQAQGASVAGYLWYLLGDMAAARTALERAGRLAADASASVRAAVDGRLAALDRAEGNLAAAAAHLADAAERSETAANRCNLWCRAADVRILLGDLPGAAEAVRRAAAEGADDAISRLDVQGARSELQAEVGELSVADARELLAFATTVDEMAAQRGAALLLARVLAEREDYAEAVELARFAAGTPGQGMRARAAALATLARLEAAAGLPDAERHLDEADTLLAGLPAQWERRVVMGARAEVAWVAGDPVAARAHLDRASALGPVPPRAERLLRVRMGG